MIGMEFNSSLRIPLFFAIFVLMSIHVEKLCKNYGQQKALNTISFSITSGEIVGFLGPNGAGKSTLMKILTGFIPPTSGNAKVCGIDVTAGNLEVRRKIGYLPESNALYTEMYVREYLRFCGGMYKVPNLAERVEEMIQLTGLSEESNKKIQALSKGYKQRVGLAAALIHDPEVLVLDEPTSGLDPNQIVEIRNLIAKAGVSKTVLLSTHIMKEVEAMCNRVLIISKGELVADDAVSQLKQGGKMQPRVIHIEFGEEVQVSEFDTLKGVLHVKALNSKTYLINCKPGEDIRSDLFNWAVGRQKTVLSMNMLEKELEQVFRELTNRK
jgi:ABC-2 type transport system ATP-binding protein